MRHRNSIKNLVNFQSKTHCADTGSMQRWKTFNYVAYSTMVEVRRITQ